MFIKKKGRGEMHPVPKTQLISSTISVLKILQRDVFVSQKPIERRAVSYGVHQRFVLEMQSRGGGGALVSSG
jgi:hypothetical protein